MSEVKGTLLGIILAISVFSIVFGIITVAVKESANTVSDRMTEIAETESSDTSGSNASYSLTY